MSLECACSDCALRQEWTIKNSGLEDKVIKPFHVYYFGNAITKVEGVNLLKTYKLRETTKTTMLVAECCNSILMADNPAYLGQVVGVGAQFTDDSCNDLPRVTRLSIETWDVEKYGELPPYTGEGKQVRGVMPDWLPFLLFKFLPNVMLRKPKREVGDITYQDLQSKKSKDLDLKKFEHIL